MKRAVNMLRAAVTYRKECFDAGLTAAGFEVLPELQKPGPDDVLLIWNRYGGYDDVAKHWESRGARVVVTENGYLGKSWRGGDWLALSLSHHLGAGQWNVGGPDRWDSWGVDLAPWRTDDTGETLILAQRGIGEPGIASPLGWAETVQKAIGGRVRKHPGNAEPELALEDDLGGVSRVVTWHSAAALKSLMLGVPVWYAFPQWIGAGAAAPIAGWPGTPRKDDAARLEMFRRLAWAQWTLDEIRSGKAFTHLLGS